MHRARPVAASALLALTLGGCSIGTSGATAGAPASELRPLGRHRSDVGNDRPRVTYDGLMVRRRVVIAVRPAPGTDVATIRRELQRAAGRCTSASPPLPGRARPALLEQLAPKLALALPPGRTVADATAVVAAGSAGGRAVPGVQDYRVATVLVHDLRFEVTSSDPQRLSQPSTARASCPTRSAATPPSRAGRSWPSPTPARCSVTSSSGRCAAASPAGPGHRPGRSWWHLGPRPVRGRHGRRARAGTHRPRGRLGPRPRPVAHRLAPSSSRASWTSAFLALVTGGCVLALVLVRIRRPRVSQAEPADLADPDTRAGPP